MKVGRRSISFATQEVVVYMVSGKLLFQIEDEFLYANKLILHFDSTPQAEPLKFLAYHILIKKKTY